MKPHINSNSEVPIATSRTGRAAGLVRSRTPRLLPAQAGSFAERGRVALIFNERAHRNRGFTKQNGASGIWWAAPDSKVELDAALSSFAQAGVGTIIIDGGDGTVRDVISRATRHFSDRLPPIAVLPSGKTNALAGDLGMRREWTAEDIRSMADRRRMVRRSPLEIRYGDEREPRLRGFVLGTGAFARATLLAQSMHRAGAFDGLAVGLSLAGALARTAFGSATSEWRRGDLVKLELDGRKIRRELYLLLASTLERMPLGLRPFGQVRSGLKVLGVDAPPRRPLLSGIALAAGAENKWLRNAGYERIDADSFRLRIDSDYVLDGERFPGGDLTITRGPPIDFVVPA